MATMRKIAQLAGVSPSTVSRVINGNVPVKEAARNKVLAAIQRLELAESRDGSMTKGNVGIIMPSSSAVNLAAHPSLYTTVLSFIETISSRSLGNTTILLDDFFSPERLNSADLLGYLILGTSNAQEEYLLPMLTACGRPFVFINRLMGNVHASCVNIDDAQATEVAVNYLLSLGHKKIAFIGGDQDFPNTRIRYSSYKRTMEFAGLTVRSDYVFYGNYSEESGAQMAERVMQLDLLPTAACIASDSIAIGFIHRLAEFGIKVPDDMSIVGFGNIEASSYVTPALTTISQNSREIGHIAALTLIQHIDNPCIYSQQVLIRTALVIRNSCAAAKK